MMAGNLQYQFARLNIAEKLIAINFVLFILARLAAALLGFDGLITWFELPKDLGSFLTQPWSIVTYAFFHAGFWHVFWNMIMLYFTGRIFLNLFNSKRFLTVYFLGVILGGLLFLASYNIFPTLVGANTALIGASAGVTAVLIFICAYIPNQEVRLFGLINIKLWYLGAFFVLVDLIQIGSGENIGGRIAHLGGAFLGYFYARQLLNGKDIGSGFENMMSSFASIFKKREKKSPLKTVYRNKKTENKSSAAYEKAAKQKKIDAILDKISKSGYESLSKAEKDFLFKAGKEN
nr:rhomboid family intramembrane serine protease [Croceivirga lutea]